MSSPPLRFASFVSFAFAGVVLMAVACSPGGGKPVDAAIFDVPQDLHLGELPPGCPPGVANDVGVGKPCTPGGGECAHENSAKQCTCDSFLGAKAPPGTPCFCTVVAFNACPVQSVCGKDAVCCAYSQQGLAIGNLCVPGICLADKVCPAYLNQ